MKKSFSILTVCVMLLGLLCFTGCAQSGSNVSTTGVKEGVTIFIDPEACASHGKTVEEIKLDLLPRLNFLNSTFKDTYVRKLDLTITETQEERNTLNQYKKDFAITTTDNNSILAVEVNYGSIDSFKFAYDMPNIKNRKTTSGFFVNTVEWTTEISEPETSYYDRVVSLCARYDEMTVLSNTNRISIEYKFRRAHSNANTVVQTDSGYVHSWSFNEKQPKEIKVYYNLANQTGFIVVALTITMLATVVFLIVAIANKRKQQKKDVR